MAAIDGLERLSLETDSVGREKSGEWSCRPGVEPKSPGGGPYRLRTLRGICISPGYGSFVTNVASVCRGSLMSFMREKLVQNWFHCGNVHDRNAIAGLRGRIERAIERPRLLDRKCDLVNWPEAFSA
jgi:hypothetical protein